MNTYTTMVFDMYTQYELQEPKSRYLGKGLTGLVNMGNTCFMTSVLHCLSHTLKLTDYFLSNRYKEDIQTTTTKDMTSRTFVNAYIRLLYSIWERNQVLRPKTFTEQLRQVVSRYKSGEQQDAHECLLLILDVLHKGLRYEVDVDIHGQVQNESDNLMKQSIHQWIQYYKDGYSFISECFDGMATCTVACTSDACTFTNTLFEPFVTLTLELHKPHTTIEEALDTHFDSCDVIQQWTCEKCKHTECTKQSRVWTLPDYLIIHINRFSSLDQKNHATIDVGLHDLDMTKYISSKKRDPNAYIYSLYAINYHTGRADNGHYFSACKNLDNHWYLFNDGHTTRYHNVSDLKANEPYLLFYHRKYIKKTDYVVDPPNAI